MRQVVVAVAALVLGVSGLVRGVAYGSINNFDAVNDNGGPCHGFEIEIEGIHSRDITYTYDWNHYGVPRITEDNADPLHARVYVRYESALNPDGIWAAYTAVPSGPIAPTDGHQFTNPAVNFGGEHFGVGFYGAPSAVRYFWLVDDGGGHLVRGTTVSIATPTFTYFPPAAAAPAQVQAVIVPPPPPAPPPLEFGEASWVRETRTSTHNPGRVELRDLVSDDPADPNDRNWMNGEPAEVEVEWQLLQTDYNAAGGGANGELVGAPEDLPGGDEVITRRYDFFKYVGPIDAETGEALAGRVAPDGSHGVGTRMVNGVEVDLSTVVVVGDYVGAQMAGFDAAGQLGLIDHLQDGEVGVAYVDRTLVVAGSPPVVTIRSGALPDGMVFDEVAGVLSGAPTASGVFTFTVHSTDATAAEASKTYHLAVLEGGVVPPLHHTVQTSAAPAGAGTTTGDGEYPDGDLVTVSATAHPGFEFVGWTDGGTQVSAAADYSFPAEVNRTLVANFLPVHTVTFLAGANGTLAGTTTQSVLHGNDATPVRATPAYLFVLDYWGDGALLHSTDNPIALGPITSDLTLTAHFRPADPLAPAGTFLARAGAGGPPADCTWWDLSGTYAASVKGSSLTLSLTHDPSGKLSGTAAYTLAKDTVVTMPIRGSVKGASGSITMKGALKGATPDKTVSVSLALNLAVDTANRQLTGPLTGSVKSGGVTTAINQNLALPVPAPMDGTWALLFQIAQSGTAVTGTATLSLSNGVERGLVVKGKAGANGTALLALAGDKSDPAAKAIRIKATISPLEGGWARVETFSGKGYGQAVAW